jgi:head-tail adaptor
MRENIYSELQQLKDIYHFTASAPCSTVTVRLWAEHFTFVAYGMRMTTNCTLDRFINVAAEQTDDMTDLRLTQRSH